MAVTTLILLLLSFTTFLSSRKTEARRHLDLYRCFAKRNTHIRKYLVETMAGRNESGDPNPDKSSNGDAARGDTKEKRSGSISEEKPNIGKINKTATGASNSSKVSAQMQKMRDANTKYKNLLKMAKERIEQQENELKEMRGESSISIVGSFWNPKLEEENLQKDLDNGYVYVIRY